MDDPRFIDDLWWLPDSGRHANLSVGVAHTPPIGDDDDVGPLYCSTDGSGNASIREQLYDLLPSSMAPALEQPQRVQNA
jgi:hypothetical protein